MVAAAPATVAVGGSAAARTAVAAAAIPGADSKEGSAGEMHVADIEQGMLQGESVGGRVAASSEHLLPLRGPKVKGVIMKVLECRIDSTAPGASTGRAAGAQPVLDAAHSQSREWA